MTAAPAALYQQRAGISLAHRRKPRSGGAQGGLNGGLLEGDPDLQPVSQDAAVRRGFGHPMARRWAETWDPKVDAARPAADAQDTADRCPLGRVRGDGGPAHEDGVGVSGSDDADATNQDLPGGHFLEGRFGPVYD